MTTPAPGGLERDAVDLTEPLAPDVPPAPHDASGEAVTTRDLDGLAPSPRPARRWTPQRVVVTPAALEHPHGQRIVERQRTTKRGRFGALKHVYPKDVMAELRSFFTDRIAQQLPACRVLYWT